MKPAPYTYYAPRTLDEAIELMATRENARVLAGGQSLVPMLNYRVAQPEHLIDLGRIPELAFIIETPDRLRIGAMTTQRTVERSVVVCQRCPLLIDALNHVGHQQTRNRGTIGGSLCHLDPSAELPVAACALDPTLIIASHSGRREIPYSDFPVSLMTSQLGPHEILIEIDFKSLSGATGTAFEEFARRPADFAIVSVATAITTNIEGVVTDARVAVGGISSIPRRLSIVEKLIYGRHANASLIEEAAAAASAEPAEGDENNPADYRQDLVGLLTQAALSTAIRRSRAFYE